MNIASVLVLVATAASPEAVERCRSAHSDDPAAHIACLEAALRAPEAVRAPDAEDEMGLDQIKQRKRVRGEGNDPIKVEIVSVSYDGRQRGVFHTAGGQVWRETDTAESRPRLSASKQYSARIVRGSFGGYRMYVDGIRWMYKVERLE